MAGPTAMLASRRQRHEAAWQDYCSARDGLTQGLQQTAAQLAAQLKALLDADDEEVEQQLGRLADDVVMELSEQGIMQVGVMPFMVGRWLCMWLLQAVRIVLQSDLICR